MKTPRNLRKLILLTGAAVTVFAGLAIGLSTTDKDASAANYLCVSERCKEAEAKEAAANDARAIAASEKNSYQAEVNKLTAEMMSIQAAIDRNNEEITELNVRINNTQKKIDQLRESLKKTLVKLYLNNNVSEFEMVASAKSMSDFTNRSANQSIVQGKVKQLTSEAKQAKEELNQQKIEVEAKKESNEINKAKAAEKQAEQQKFVDDWRGRESTYAVSAAENKKIREEEQEKQRQIIWSQQGGGGYSGDPSKGGYPYAGECPWNADTNAPLAGQLGYGLKCECYSYGIWKIFQHTGSLPTNLRNYNGPKDWYGLSGFNGAGTTPRQYSAAISTSGYFGHVVWVEWLNPNGTIHISQYNATPWQYSEDDVWPSAFNWYLYY
jgi:peptidoglycan hydrolase CwlO-like protein